MSDYLIGVMESLSEKSGYSAEDLMDIYLECEDITIEEFENITMEHDW